MDDFGISAYGVMTMQGGQPPQSIPLGQAVPGQRKARIEHTLCLEDLQAQPDQLLSYYFWADDAGPDGKPRRTRSDMFFIEVRPFEEIYRQGQQPTEGEIRQQEQNQGGRRAASRPARRTAKADYQCDMEIDPSNRGSATDRARDAGVIRDSQKSPARSGAGAGGAGPRAERDRCNRGDRSTHGVSH